ncbi:putative leucine-rich repeat receptor-like serine/threonine-protein kinase At2g24130 [Triticum dicoccoides]|uniref:putative leucine-rich repeat receptor-like serine/threonine-protein kinase At2g24130 n=1 Tax=Triticum dicoccoides TaxID=85692 RepID=UPI0018903BA5|nr:putative leucine-rich repeat receptor-like serine/threonine-protein kinase At2g24130 [Triticum dicoccoides]
MVARPITAFIFTFLLFFLFLHTASPALLGEDVDRSVLLVFKAGVSGDPKGALVGWGSPDVCNWTGVACDAEHHVVELILSEQELCGEVSPALGNLSHLRTLNLSGNHFTGSVPPELGNLSYLKFLDFLYVSLNTLTGTVPPELGNLSRLKFLDLSSNMLTRTVPPELGNLSRLKFLDVSSNTLTGAVPPELGNLSRLGILDLSENVFSGAVPQELGKLSRLTQLSLNGNKLEGSIPVELSRIRRLVYLNLGDNNLSGHIPSAIFCNLSALNYNDMSSNFLDGEIPIQADCPLPELMSLVLWSNKLNGSIPPSLSNSTKLRWLLLQSNFLTGELPSDDMFSGMRSLEYLHLSSNFLANSRNNTDLEPFFASLANCTDLKELSVARNDIVGMIPPVIGRLAPSLMQLHLQFNRLFGPIPANISNLTNLNTLNLSHNLFNGSIPQGIPSMRQLEQLHLSNNLLSGDIPLSLGMIPWLGLVNFSQNRLTGAIPPSIVQCVMMQNLDLSYNMLGGEIPAGLTRLSGLLNLNLAGNLLSGVIPVTMGEMVRLQLLNLSSNQLSGTIPPQLGSCIELKYLDVSGNGLTGTLPQSLEKVASLLRVNFSYNDFSGEVPSGGVFAGFLADAFLGNDRLCAGTASMTPGLARCSGAKRNLLHSRRVVLLVVGTVASFTMAIIGLATLLDPKNVGGEVSRSFKRECDVLRRTRHRNLVRVITTCSQPNFHAIVLPLMTNGSLESHLYPCDGGPGRGMDLAWLIGIAGGIAEGLTYLHHYAPVRVIHCDLKPSNVLLDDDMTAVVADFGIARLVKDMGDDDNTCFADPCNSTAGLLQGSVGYIAPEYGLGGHPSTEGDVYSFGVMLLELITGKRPTDVLFQEGLTLHGWVRRHHPRDLTTIVAPPWLVGTDVVSSAVQASNVVVELMDLGIACTQYSPPVRPTMVEVCRAIALLKDSSSS